LENVQIYLLGFIAQAFFGSRLIIQWWQSEKSRAVVSPTLYWYLSLCGSILFLAYGLIRRDPVVIAGQFLSYFIYVRNLQLKKVWGNISSGYRVLILILPFLCVAWFFDWTITGDLQDYRQWMTDPVMIVGTIGQLALNFRFLYQWYYSEKFESSVLPFGFWVISTWASVLVIFYSVLHPIYGIEPVLLVSQTLGIVVYLRNMMLSRVERAGAR
jgi:lipid-A-disaccharide synthase-like uncharacterized protein